MIWGVGNYVIKKWFKIITDHRISLYERMFRLVTGICMLALIFTMPMGRTLWNFIIMVIYLISIALIVKYSIQKKRIRTGATAIAVLLLTLFHVFFFKAGGF